MDVMSLRRGLLMQMASGAMIGSYDCKQVIVDSNRTNALQISDWITSNMPSGATTVIVIKDEMDKSNFVNNQLAVAMVFDGVPKSWVRYRDNAYVIGTTWTSAYSLSVSQGEKYIFLYQ